MNLSREDSDKVDLQFKIKQCEEMIQQRQLEIEALTVLMKEFQEEMEEKFRNHKDN